MKLNYKSVFCVDDPFNSCEWEIRDAKITDSKGKVIFELKKVEAPKQWSQLAVNIVASKYFYTSQDKDIQETSVKQLVSRVAGSISRWGYENGYFLELEDSKAFERDLTWLLINQYGSFNSPVWFNTGIAHTYKLKPGEFTGFRYDVITDKIILSEKNNEYTQNSACFIQSVDDDMESIMNLAKSEAKLFKKGSGSGTDLSTLRSSKESLSSGGTASGPLSFLKIYDTVANVVKSGGKCLSPDQLVYTEKGPIAVSKLINKEFIVLSYDPPSKRIKAKKANAWKSGRKQIVSIVTDKGYFKVSVDHPVRLADNQIISAGKLIPGMSLHAGTINLRKDGYLRVGIQDGNGSKKLLHRLIIEDINQKDISNLVVHHTDETCDNNSLDNLVTMSQSQHAKLHSNKKVKAGTHIFVTHTFSHTGKLNGMHHSSDFYKNAIKYNHYCNLQGSILKKSGRSLSMQKAAVKQKMLNYGYTLLNKGFILNTFEDYTKARIAYCGYNQRNFWREKIDNQFGSYTNYLKELSKNNHKVISVTNLGYSDVYSVEVICDTEDDKSNNSGHNFMIWPNDNKNCYGSGIFVLNTRRAAKLNLLSISHPDIKEFIFCKLEEDKKLKTLIESGFVIDNPSDYAFYQNVNLSVKISNKFMLAVENDEEWKTKLVSNPHKNGPVYQAKQLFNWIAETAHSCGDPGLAFIDTINKANTCATTCYINSGNPCFEYLWVDNSSCNLASLNLIKFIDNGKFDLVKFANAIRVFIIAQDILVDRSSYPTEQIAQNSHDYRPLGLGHANLGGLLMSLGIPYSSHRGRNIASVITSYMTCYAYQVSNELAGIKPFTHYEVNKEPFAHILTKHCEAASDLVDDLIISVSELKVNWRKLTTLNSFRNAQVTLEAPTGTIGYIMDCDTTGVEPELGLVKYKSLVGGGTLTIVNQTIETSLKSLGYKDSDIKSIIDYITTNGTIEGSCIETEHLPVFDCALRTLKGKRVLSWEDHINMVAAIQPHLSGGISKTINMANTDTVEDVKNAYMLAWKKGLKGITIYRDGSKYNQPLNLTKKKEEVKIRRQRLPETRDSVTHRFSIAGHEGYFTVGKFPDGRPGELFVTMAKEGSTVGGLMDSFGIGMSMCLQFGVPLKTLVDKFSQSRFEPAGMTSNKEIPMCTSIVDYIARWLKLKFLDKQGEDKVVSTIQEPVTIESSGPICDQCGAITIRNGSCFKCGNCGASLGCS